MVTTKQTNSLCPICLEENATDLVTLTCKHIVCRPCFLRLIFVPNAFTKCPMCRSVISLGKLFKKGKEFQRLSWITVYDQFRARSLWRPQIVLHATPKIYYTSELWNVMCTMLWLVIYLLYCIAEFLPMQKKCTTVNLALKTENMRLNVIVYYYKNWIRIRSSGLSNTIKKSNWNICS